MVDAEMVRNAIRGRGGRFFTIAFKRKTKGKEGEPVGSLRRMVCRRHVRKYVAGVLAPGERAAQDRRCEVLTVFDVQAFHKNRREGMRLSMAGKNAYRRINLAEVVEFAPLAAELAR